MIFTSMHCPIGINRMTKIEDVWEKFSMTRNKNKQNIYMCVKNKVSQKAEAVENILQLIMSKVLFEIVSF